MIELYSDLEGISKMEGNSKIDISDSYISYLKELNVPSDNWKELSPSQQKSILEHINYRLDEIGINDDLQKTEILSKTFSTGINESYHERLESAPNDIEQIDRISDSLISIEDLEITNWEKLDLYERLNTLNTLEREIAEIERRPACLVYAENMGAITIEDNELRGILGGFNPETKHIMLNAEMIESNDPIALHEVLDTIIHEGRHAYQDYNVNEWEVHPRHAEVVSWAETMEGGKWGYHGDLSSVR